MSAPDARAEDLRARLTAVHERIATACAAARRDPAEITLTVVTKFFPAADVRKLAGLGVGHVGENRHQEAVEKAAECADLGLTWHFIGQLQSKKAAAVARYAGVVESVDRPKLVTGLGRGAMERSGERAPLDCLVQVSLDADPGRRGGAAPAAVVPLAEQIAAAEGLRLRGVMAVAPVDEEPESAFTRLAEIAAQVRSRFPDATWVSAGMSGDLEAAVACGATHLRIGSAVLGPRPPVQ